MELFTRWHTAVLTALLVLSPIAYPVTLEPPLVVASIESSSIPGATQPDAAQQAAQNAIDLELTLGLDNVNPDNSTSPDWRKLEQLALSSPPAVLDFIVLDTSLPNAEDSQHTASRGTASLGIVPLIGSLLLLVFGISLLLGQLGGHRVRHLRPFQQLRHARSQLYQPD